MIPPKWTKSENRPVSLKKAANTFVWLCHSSSDTLTRSLDILESRGPELWDSDGKLPDVGLIQDIYEAAKTIFSDPWFSSLWTLQEVVIRNDALILSATAEPVTVESGYLFSMIMLINICMNIHRRLSISLSEGTDPGGMEKRFSRPRPLFRTFFN